MAFNAGAILHAAELAALDGLLNMASATIATNQSTASTAFVDLASVGPSVTLTTRGFALVMYAAQGWNSTATSSARFGYAVSNATTVAASVAKSGIITAGASGDAFRVAMVDVVALTPGSNTFTMKYSANAGTAFFQNRQIAVWAP